jgi:hypothetical protein
MSNFYYDIPELATVPKCTTVEFLRWCETFRRTRRAEALAMLEGETVYYFSTSGLDANDGLTDATPKKTIGAAQAILAAWSNDVSGLVLKFKCGDIWQPDTAGEGKLDFSGKYNVAVTNYGDQTLGLPFFNRWKTPVQLSSFETSVTRADAFANTYSVAKPGAESWYTIRLYGRKDVAFRHVSSIAEVDAAPGTCWVNHAGDGRLYFRPYTTRSQLLEYYECLTPDPTFTQAMIGNNNTTGVLATGKVAVVGVEISGVCIGPYGADGTAGNAIHLRGYGDATLYVLDSCITYCSRHHIVTASGSGSQPSYEGVILFVDNCSVGWQSSQGGAVLITANSLEGGTEMFCSHVAVLGGYIPRPDALDGGTAFISHTSGAPYVTLLDVIYECHATATPGQITNFGGFGDMSDAGTDIEACRHFIVNCSIPHRQKYINEGHFDSLNKWSASGLGDAQFIINSYVGMTQLGSLTNAGNPINAGMLTSNHINCTISVDCGLDSSRPASDITSWYTPVASILASMFHCLFETKNVLAGQFAWVSHQRSQGTSPGASYIANRCVFLNRSSPVRRVNLYHNAVWFGFNTEECAYSGMSRYFVNSLIAGGDYTTKDPSYKVFQEIGGKGVPDDLVLDTDSYVTFGGEEHALEYDADGLPRSGRNAIGPRRSAVPLPSEDEVIGVRAIGFDTTAPSSVPYGETEIIAVGEGRDWLFSADDVPVDPTAEDEWSVVYTGFGLSAPLVFDHEDAENVLVVDADAWTIRAVVTSAHTAAMIPGSWGTVDLVYQPNGDDRVIMRRKTGRVVAG